MNKVQTRSLSRLFLHFLCWTFLIIVGAILWLNSRYILDFINSSLFEPSSEVKNLSDNIGFHDNARMIFYATNPKVESADEFNKNCTNHREKTTILGCYKFNDRIHIFDVKNTELTGIKEVTAAHEFLHAVWARMNSGERDKISKLLLAEYEKLKTPEFEALMADYAKAQPGDHENELHSIIGTEYDNLSPELELHYSKYFKDRSRIVNYHKQYRDKFINLEKQAEKIQGQIKDLKSQIDTDSKKYQEELSILNARIEKFNQDAQSGFYEDRAIFMADRERIKQDNNYLILRQKKLNNKIDAHNKLIEELNKIAEHSAGLQNSINSRISEPKSL